MKTLVLSGINLFEGGTLSIYYDCLNEIRNQQLNKEYRIVAFVHKRALFTDYEDIAEIIEMPKSRRSYLNRIYYEYIYFKKYSGKHDVDIWFSLHDMTPCVKSKRLYTYCHNPSPFLKRDLSKLKYSWKVVAFSYFYKYLYRINIHKADGIIVQSDWMRNAFKSMYHIDNVIVARPEMSVKDVVDKSQSDKTIFVYPSLSRYFKNFEVICEACKEIDNDDFEVWLTIDGSEDKYSRDLRTKYGSISCIKWMGRQTREKVYEMYSNADCLIFPSKAETWGLPISEFKNTGKDIILANLPYAHETLGKYEKAMFFNPDDSTQLVDRMLSVIKKTEDYESCKDVQIQPPFALNWKELMKIIIADR